MVALETGRLAINADDVAQQTLEQQDKSDPVRKRISGPRSGELRCPNSANCAPNIKASSPQNVIVFVTGASSVELCQHDFAAIAIDYVRSLLILTLIHTFLYYCDNLVCCSVKSYTLFIL